MFKTVQQRFLICLIGILLFAFVTRIYNLAHPAEFIFDEVYHAVTAKLIRRNDPRAFEWWNPPIEPSTAVDWLHPPLAKYTQALGMEVFGENSFGWRISSVLFGVLVIAATAGLAHVLFADRKVTMFSTALASLDGLLLVQSRIAMNDIHVTFFILLTLICYLIYRQKNTLWWLFLAGLSAGLAMGSKWSGVYVLIAVCLCEAAIWLKQLWFVLHKDKKIKVKAILIAKKKKIRASLVVAKAGKTTKPTSLKQKYDLSKRSLLAPIFANILFLLLIPATVYLLSYTDMFLQGKTLFCEGNQVEQGKCYCRQESSWWVDGLKGLNINNQWLWQMAVANPVLQSLIPNPLVWESLLEANPNELPNFWENLEARGGCKRLVSHFSELNFQIWYYQTHLTATHPFQSRPWQWFWDLRPVWFYTKNTATTAENIYTFGNPLIFWLGDAAVLVSIGAVVIWAWKKKWPDTYPCLRLAYSEKK